MLACTIYSFILASPHDNDKILELVSQMDAKALMQMGCGNRTEITAWAIDSDVAAFAYPCADCTEGQHIFETHLNTTEVLHYLASRCSFNWSKYLTTFAEMKPVPLGISKTWLMPDTPGRSLISESLLSDEKSNLCAVRGCAQDQVIEFHIFDIPSECIHLYKDRFGLTFYSIFMGNRGLGLHRMRGL